MSVIGKIDSTEQILCERKELVKLAHQNSVKNPYSDQEKKKIKNHMQELNELLTKQAAKIRALEEQLRNQAEEVPEKERPQ